MLKLLKNYKIEFVMIFLGCFLFINTFIGSDWASHYSADPVGTAAMPRFFLILLIACNILRLYSKDKIPSDKEEDENEIPTLNPSQTLIFSLFALTTVLHIYSSWYIGLFISTLVYLLVWLKVFGNSTKITVIYSVLGTAVIYYFINLAQVFFPKGLLF